MRLDFWNNPIIVSAFRVKYRRSAPSLIAMSYLVGLFAIGVACYRYAPALGLSMPWQRAYFLTVIALQYVLSGLIALQGTAASIQGEVNNRTLDFQRIATLSPARILLGKLLGEPAIAYLLAIATIPVSLGCSAIGAVAPFPLVMLYVTLATTTLLCGALGLLHRLEPPAGKTTGGSTSGGVVAALLIGMIILPTWIGLVFSGSNAIAVAGVGSITPLPLLHGVAVGNVWLHRMPFFSWRIPYLFWTPLSQLAATALLFSIMVRRLHNPLNTALSKPTAYVLLLLVDVLAVAVLYDPILDAYSAATFVVAVGLIHLLASLWLMLCVTPRREALVSWIWRFRFRRPLLQDLWIGPRTQNGAALITFCIIGAAVLGLLVLVPVAWRAPRSQVFEAAQFSLFVTLVTALVLLAVGTLYQWMLLVADRSGAGICLTLVGTLMLVPLVAGEYYDRDLLRAFSPISHFVRWFRVGTETPVVDGGLAFHRVQPLSLVPLLLAYGLLLVYAWASLRRRLLLHTRLIERKLERMGVAPKHNRAMGIGPPYLTVPSTDRSVESAPATAPQPTGNDGSLAAATRRSDDATRGDV